VLRIPLRPAKDIASDLLIKIFLGHKSSPVCPVFETEVRLQKFSMFVRLPNSTSVPDPTSYVTFTLPERPNRVQRGVECVVLHSHITILQVIMWLNQSFLVNHELNNTLDEAFTDLRTGKVLKMSMKVDGEVRTFVFDFFCFFVFLFFCFFCFFGFPDSLTDDHSNERHGTGW
jgi:hypothetical protein